MTLIIDASVAIKWFVQENLHTEARRIFDYRRDIEAPDFIMSEVANIAWKKVRRAEISREQAAIIVTAMPQYIPKLSSLLDYIEDALDLALELDHPVYDCIYLACTMKNEGVFVTADKRLFNKLQFTAYENIIKFVDDPDLITP